MKSRTRDDAPTGSERAIRTFLIADIRGYTAFTRERGDEAAAVLASRFAELVREGVEAWDGELAELRGDEALAVFHSARRALRCALELQDAFAHEVALDPSLPLRVGMGLDAGEAVPVEEGYRGGALNLAARLCSHAKAGEVLASDGVVHLARATDGVRFEPLRRWSSRGSARRTWCVSCPPRSMRRSRRRLRRRRVGPNFRQSSPRRLRSPAAQGAAMASLVVATSTPRTRSRRPRRGTRGFWQDATPGGARGGGAGGRVVARVRIGRDAVRRCRQDVTIRCRHR